MAFFDLIGWHVFTLIVVSVLAASSVDTLQTRIVSVFSSDLLRLGASDTALFISRVTLAIVLIPAVVMSSKRFDVIALLAHIALGSLECYSPDTD